MKSSKKSAPRKFTFDSPEQELYLNLWRTYDCLKGAEDQLFNQYGISAQQYNLLRILQHVDPKRLPTLKLGKGMISRGPDITRMLDRLARLEFIDRQRQPENRRIVQVGLTDRGRQLLSDLAENVQQMHARQLAHLTSDEQMALLGLLKKAREPLEDHSCGWLNYTSPLP